MMVRALAPGFYGGRRRHKGDVFRISDGTIVGKWMVLVPDPQALVQAPAGLPVPRSSGVDPLLEELISGKPAAVIDDPNDDNGPLEDGEGPGRARLRASDQFVGEPEPDTLSAMGKMNTVLEKKHRKAHGIPDSDE